VGRREEGGREGTYALLAEFLFTFNGNRHPRSVHSTGLLLKDVIVSIVHQGASQPHFVAGSLVHMIS
jgi:hypothetical protein